MPIRKRRITKRGKKSSGHPFMVLLFFICLIMGSAYMTDRMTNAPDADMAENVTAIRHIFNDKEMQGLVPKDDPGTPESVKEKVKAALNKAVTVEVKADDESADQESSVSSSDKEVSKGNGEEGNQKDTSHFSLERVIAKVTGKEESSSQVAPAKETVVASREEAKEEQKKDKETISKPDSTASSNGTLHSKGATQTAQAASSSSDKKSSDTTMKKGAVASSNSGSSSKQSQKAAPSKVTPIVPAQNTTKGAVTGRLAIVIDDAGRDLNSQSIYEKMGIPLTLAVMPNQIHTREAAASWASHGLPVIIHQPMESVSGIGMEPKVILTSMSDEAIRQMLKESFSQIPEAVGMNNHQGSKATTNRHTMDVVMNELSHRKLFFFDSHTNSTTEADKAAAAYGVPYVKNDLFVDNSANEADICQMIQEGANRAKKYGTYIIIGHCRTHTAAAFQTMVPKLKAQGIEFVYVSSLVR